MTIADPTLDADLRRTDPDRWLSSRFVASSERRSSLVAFYALDGELARVGQIATNPLAGEIRLAWWLEELELAARSGPVAANPILQTLARGVGPALPVRTIERVIEARRLALGGGPAADEAALVAHIDETAGAAMIAAATLIAADWTDKPQLLHAGRAWGWSEVARGRTPKPVDWTDATAQETAVHIAHRVAEALKTARQDLAHFPVAAFPAVAHVALAKAYAEGRAMSELGKRARITGAVLGGRL